MRRRRDYVRAAATALAGLTVTLVSSTAVAQAPAHPAAGRTMVSAADIAAITAKLKAQHKDQATMGQALLQSGGYNVALEYRTGVAHAAVHENDAEFFYVIDRSATLTSHSPRRP